jgi:hypothetical protein
MAARSHEPKHLVAGVHEPDNIVTNSSIPRFKMPRGTVSGLSSLSPVLVSRSPALSSGFVPACKSRGPSVTPPVHSSGVLGTVSPSRPTFVHLSRDAVRFIPRSGERLQQAAFPRCCVVAAAQSTVAVGRVAAVAAPSRAACRGSERGPSTSTSGFTDVAGPSSNASRRT